LTYNLNDKLTLYNSNLKHNQHENNGYYVGNARRTMFLGLWPNRDPSKKIVKSFKEKAPYAQEPEWKYDEGENRWEVD